MSNSNIVGTTLGGRYKIQSLIGQGGMASVYKAHDPNLHRSVAIKVIHPHLSDNPDFFRRFEEEATAVAQLRHPNIVQVYDFAHDEGLYYMVMEFVMGETLQTRLKRLNESGRLLSNEEAATFTAEICEAAHYAHERGMIHRDIKPANIMLDVNGRAILMDFGIARMVDAAQHTATGTVLGTAMYMSPEQIQGLQIDARADIYSIGITLFEMLSGKPPFEADSAMTLMMMHLNDPVPNLQEMQVNTPPGLVAITNKALAKNRDERYQSANEMAAELRQLPDQPQAAAAGVPATAPDATIVEAAVMAGAGETIVEGAAAVERPAEEVQYQPTLVEQPVQPVQQAAAPAAAPPTESMPAEKKRRTWIPILVVLLIAIIGGGGYFAYSNFFAGGTGSPAATPTAVAAAVLPATDTPEATQEEALEETQEVIPAAQPEATETALPSPTSTEAPTPTPAPVTIGGADKIAFISGKNVWAANLDGSEQTQLTDNSSDKTYLRWLPDGQGLSYISGKCIEAVSLAGNTSQITCFNNSDRLEGFEVSPDGTQVVIGLDGQVYQVPFDLEALSSAYSHDSLSALATCANLAPYTRNSARYVRWSRDSRRWAVVIQVPYKGLRADVVAVFPVDTCFPDAYAAFEVQFPPPHFTFPGYDDNPIFQDLGFDGNAVFAFHGQTRNGGFGDLHLFNLDSFRFSESVNPINNTCCYRDAEFSPDGNYLVFAYQDIGLGQESTTKLYYIPFGSIGTGESYEPLPLPDIADVKERPQPVLRPAAP
jgi:tRNA A-37 threonylcarbamoyl transferase component Bud32